MRLYWETLLLSLCEHIYLISPVFDTDSRKKTVPWLSRPEVARNKEGVFPTAWSGPLIKPIGKNIVVSISFGPRDPAANTAAAAAASAEGGTECRGSEDQSGNNTSALRSTLPAHIIHALREGSERKRLFLYFHSCCSSCRRRSENSFGSE